MKTAEYVVCVLRQKKEPARFRDVVQVVMKDASADEGAVKAAIWRLNSEGVVRLSSDLKLRLKEDTAAPVPARVK